MPCSRPNAGKTRNPLKFAGMPQTTGSISAGAPEFSAHVYCGQTAGWIKMPLGMKVGLSPGDSVLDGDPAPLRTKGVEPCLLWPNGWMDEEAAWYGSRPRPRPHCTRRGPSSREWSTAAPSLFSVHVYCGHGRPSQILLSSCFNFPGQDSMFLRAGKIV